jgi:tetratricopeptide (TPR) repeat protein
MMTAIMSGRSLLDESLALHRAAGDKRGVASSSFTLGEIARLQGAYGQAVTYYNESLVLRRELGLHRETAAVLCNLGHAGKRQRNYGQAAAWFRESLLLWSDLRDMVGVADGLGGLAGIIGIQGQPEQAARLLGAAKVLRDTSGTHIMPYEQGDYARTVAHAHAHLNDTTFTKAWAEGQAMSLEQAIAYALNENGEAGDVQDRAITR